jgi:hypothetical protein
VEREGDDWGHEERRYVPEGKTEGQWKELCRKMTGLRDKSARESEEKARLLMEAQDELLSKQAEIDGLRWAVEERDQLIRDMRSVIEVFCDSSECDSCPALGEGVPCSFGEVDGRMKALGIVN